MKSRLATKTFAAHLVLLFFFFFFLVLTASYLSQKNTLLRMPSQLRHTRFHFTVAGLPTRALDTGEMFFLADASPFDPVYVGVWGISVRANGPDTTCVVALAGPETAVGSVALKSPPGVSSFPADRAWCGASFLGGSATKGLSCRGCGGSPTSLAR